MTPIGSISWARDLFCLAAVSVALVLQVSVFGHLAWQGVVPDLVLLVVVATALVHGTEYAVVVGFCAGLLLDLAPPADGVAGRWALSLLVVGYTAGRLRAGQPSMGGRRIAVVALVASCAFVGTSVYAITGLVLHDHATAVPGLLRVVGVAVVWDVVLGLVVVPLVARGFALVTPERMLLG